MKTIAAFVGRDGDIMLALSTQSATFVPALVVMQAANLIATCDNHRQFIDIKNGQIGQTLEKYECCESHFVHGLHEQAVMLYSIAEALERAPGAYGISKKEKALILDALKAFDQWANNVNDTEEYCIPQVFKDEKLYTRINP